MNICFIIFLIAIIVIVVIILVIKNTERYVDYPDIPNKSINMYSCWEHIKNTTNWDLNVMTNEQIKVLLTIRPLNATIYSDDNREFPDWRNKCVIPAAHLPIYNQDSNKTDIWVIKNNTLRYTNNTENPRGFVIELDKYTEQSFKQLLLDLYELYDNEFLDEEKNLQKQIDKWEETKKAKALQLKEIKADISTQQAILNSMLDPNSECQQNKKILDDLQTEINKVRADITSIEQSMPVVPPYPPPLKPFEQIPEYSWTCKPWSDVNMYTPTGKNSSGDVQCMSENARDCFWFNDQASCINKINNPPQNVNPLVCGQNHKEQWGVTGYDNPTHWCSTYDRSVSVVTPPPTDWTKVDGSLVNLSLSGDNVCGTNANYDIFCSKYGTSDWTKIPGGLKQLSIDGTKSCGVNTSDKIWCTDNIYSGNWQSLPAYRRLSQIDISGNKMCGINAENQIWCATYGQDDWTQRPGVLKHISISGNRACGVNSSDDIYCADNIDNPDWTKIDGSLKQIDIDGDKVCGVNSGDEIWCSDYKRGNWNKIPGALKYMSIDRNRAYGVNSGDQIWYRNNI